MSSLDQVKWPSRLLLFASVFHLAAAVTIVAQPSVPWSWADVATPVPPETWQAYGLVLGALGVGFAIAATAPAFHWCFVFVSLIIKVAIPVGYFVSASSGKLSWSLLPEVLTADVLWWLPLGAILYYTAKVKTDTSTFDVELSWEECLQRHRSQRGATLLELSEEKRTLVVFVRHAGCTFCREMLSDLAAQKSRLESRSIDVQIAVVHMGSPMRGTELAIEYDIEGVHLFSDPTCELYEAFGLERGSIRQLFGPKVLARGFWAGLVGGHGIGPLQGDGFRLQGAFLLEKSKVISYCRAQTAADPIDFISVCKAPSWNEDFTSGAAATV